MLDLPLFRTDDDPYHVKLAYEMGNFLTDGFGFVISSDDLLNFNGETTDIAEYWLTNCYGISRFMVADHIEHNARAKHIDQYMKFLDEETLLVGQLAPTNPKAVEIEQKIENQINELMSSYLSVWGRPFKVVRIPFPDLTDELASVFYTYTNSLIVNNYVLVPLYGVAEDQQALQIYKENMPAHRVVGYDCREIIQYGGAIHCITHEIARKHSLIPSSGQLPDTLTVPNGSYSSYERFVARNFISAGAGVSVKAGGFVVAKTAGTIRLKSGFSAKNGCFFRAYISNY
jgi:agmatine/peptidylarginine deiminase